MKVKVGDTIYDGEDQPVMVILSNEDKSNIANMLPANTKYISYPESMSIPEIRAWLKTEGEPA